MNFKKYFRFSLRRFLICIALFALVSGWFGRRAYNQRFALTKLSLSSFTYDFELKPRVTFSLFPNDNSPQADLIRNILGNDVFGNIVQANIDDGLFPNGYGPEYYPVDLSYLAYLPKLEKLFITVRSLTDDDIAILKFTPNLKDLELTSTFLMMHDNATLPPDWFTEKSFEIFCDLSDLERLVFVTGNCPDDAILRLSCLKKLKQVQIFRLTPEHIDPHQELIKQFHEKLPQLNVKDIVIY